jgi:hypothetical protein
MDTEIKFDYIVVGDVSTPELPTAGCTLAQNAPNPFNPSTTISFSLDAPAHAQLTVFNARGQKVTTLVDATLASGLHTTVWNGTDDAGNPVSSGVYFYQMQVDDQLIDRKRALLLK